MNTTKATAQEGSTVNEIESATGGTYTNILDSDKIYLESAEIIDSITEAVPKVTNFQSIKSYVLDGNAIDDYVTQDALDTALDTSTNFVAMNPTLDTPAEENLDKVLSDINANAGGDTYPKTIRKTVLPTETSGVTYNVDLTPYKEYSKFHIQFPIIRYAADITANITGLNELIVPMQSIMMSGLDNTSHLIEPSLRGTTTFTLDSDEYEFPASIYQFTAMSTCSTPEYIFLQIDYAEGEDDSTTKYIMENAIYATQELWTYTTSATESAFTYTPQVGRALMMRFNKFFLDFLNPSSSYDFLEHLYYTIENTDSTSIQMYIYMHGIYNATLSPICNSIGYHCRGGKIYVSDELYAAGYDDYAGYDDRHYRLKNTSSLLFTSDLTITISDDAIAALKRQILYYDSAVATDGGIFEMVAKGCFAAGRKF